MRIILTEHQIKLLMESEDIFFDLVKKVNTNGLESLKPSELTLYRKYKKHLKKGGELADFKDVDEYDEKYGMVIKSDIPELHGLTFIYDEMVDLDDLDDFGDDEIEDDLNLVGSISFGGQIGWDEEDMDTISFAVTPKGVLIDYVITNMDDFKDSSGKLFQKLSEMNPNKDNKSLQTLFKYFLTDEIVPLLI